MDLISGATGFIGQRLAKLVQCNERSLCRLVSRDPRANDPWFVADLTIPESLAAACSGIHRIFHCAGHAHAFFSKHCEDAKQHWLINFEGTRNLVEAAGRAGVQRFVFLSSVKTMGETGDACADENFLGPPVTAYGQSKLAAEKAVLDAGQRYGMHVVNLRLAMVYGSGGRGNLERMGRLVRQGWFPPLPETGNHRSMVHVNDVVAAMLQVVDDDRANGRTYIITGPEAPSGRQLYDAMREVLGLPPCSWYVPEPFLRSAALCGDLLENVLHRRVLLDSEVADRLLRSAWYSSDRLARELGWQPKVSLHEGLREMFGC